jgi:carboxyl-terminal processing protease
MSKNISRYQTIRLAMALLILLGGALNLAEAVAVEQQELAGLIYKGKFEQAQKTLTTQPVSIVNRPTDPMRSRLSNYNTLLSQREEVRQSTYDENIAEAQKYYKKGDIEKALTSTRKARFYAKDTKAFGQIPWIKEMAGKSRTLADGYLKKHEWLKAGNIYAELATIYEDDKTYDKLTRDAAMRVRLEATYKPDGEWKNDIEDIKIDVVPEVSLQIYNYYVENPDFTKMVSRALGNLEMMKEIPKLSEVFKPLGEKDKCNQFDQQLKELEKQVTTQNKNKKFATREFWQAFLKLLVINDETCQLPRNVIIREFLDAALAELDPFTNVIWPAELNDFDKHTTGRFSGVGIQISMENNKLKVVTPIPSSPAFQAGILPGDLIVSIDGEKTDGISIDQAVRKITGPKGTKVTLGIQHPWNDELRIVPLVRDTIVIETVKGYKLDKDNNWKYMIDPENKIAYIRVTSFTDTTPSELTDALEFLTKNGARGLILDLRFNPGGTLKAAVETVDLFIDEGVIVSTRGRNVEPWQKSASPKDTRFRDLPIIVLINSYSASAAEIVSGALKDYHRAWLIGERSFGKGSVQNVLPIVGDTCRLKITTAHYYLPSGKCIHRKPESKEWGVDPNLKVELTPSELRDVIELQRDAEIVIQVNGKSAPKLSSTTATSTPTTTATSTDSDAEGDSKKPRKYPPVDVQLDAAMVVMQSRLSLGVSWDEIPTTNPTTKSIRVDSK